jgi:hypothetical protein
MGAMLGDDERRRLRQVEHLARAVAGAHGERYRRAASRAEGRNMIDGVVGRGDLLQGLTLVPLLAARGPVRWSAQAFGPRRPRRLLEPVARRRLAAVGTIQSEPALKFRKTRFQSCNFGRLGRHERNQLFLRRPGARIRIIHRILESKPDSVVEENLPAQPPTQPINLGSYQDL